MNYSPNLIQNDDPIAKIKELFSGNKFAPISIPPQCKTDPKLKGNPICNDFEEVLVKAHEDAGLYGLGIFTPPNSFDHIGQQDFCFDPRFTWKYKVKRNKENNIYEIEVSIFEGNKEITSVNYFDFRAFPPEIKMIEMIRDVNNFIRVNSENPFMNNINDIHSEFTLEEIEKHLKKIDGGPFDYVSQYNKYAKNIKKQVKNGSDTIVRKGIIGHPATGYGREIGDRGNVFITVPGIDLNKKMFDISYEKVEENNKTYFKLIYKYTCKIAFDCNYYKAMDKSIEYVVNVYPHNYYNKKDIEERFYNPASPVFQRVNIDIPVDTHFSEYKPTWYTNKHVTEQTCVEKLTFSEFIEDREFKGEHYFEIVAPFVPAIILDALPRYHKHLFLNLHWVNYKDFAILDKVEFIYQDILANVVLSSHRIIHNFYMSFTNETIEGEVFTKFER